MKTIHGKNVNDFCERTGKTNKKNKRTFRHNHSKAETILIEIWIQVFKMSAHFGHMVHQMRRKIM